MRSKASDRVPYYTQTEQLIDDVHTVVVVYFSYTCGCCVLTTVQGLFKISSFDLCLDPDTLSP
jgi:hypothetical protein